MRLTTSSKLGYVLLILACGVSDPRCLLADESPVAALDVKEEMFGSARDQGRLAWAILEAIEQHHIAPPPRQALVKIIARAFAGIKKSRHVDPIDQELIERLDAEILQCQSANEMADVFERVEDRTPDLNSFIADIISGHMTSDFGELPGGFHLIRAKDHDVTEQIRSNRYVGLGVRPQMNAQNHLPVFAEIVPGGPADRGGLKRDTYIHEVDGRPTKNIPLETVVDWIRGPIGTDVTLKISSDGANEQRFVTLKRGLIRLDSLRSHKHLPLTHEGLRFDPREPVGWISVGDITSSTLHELRVAEQNAKVDGIRVLVLDFRGLGPSGDLHQSLLVADGLLDGGAIWEQVDRMTEPRIEFADRECLFRDIPLVILIDRTTRPCHCAIAAALQDAGRAKLVGESPVFQGMIPGTVRLGEVPYSLTMATTRLKRARKDRQWPLELDYSGAEDNGSLVGQTAIPPGFRIGDRVILESDLYSKSSDSNKIANSKGANKSTYPGDSAQNTPKGSNAPDDVVRENSPIRSVTTQRKNNELPARPVPSRRRLPIEDAAILVALELQRALPSKSELTASDSRHPQNKDSTK